MVDLRVDLGSKSKTKEPALVFILCCYFHESKPNNTKRLRQVLIVIFINFHESKVKKEIRACDKSFAPFLSSS